MAKKRKLITRRSIKWAGLLATICLTTGMVASYWYWPSFYWAKANSSRAFFAGLGPSELLFVWDQTSPTPRDKAVYKLSHYGRANAIGPPGSPPIVWLVELEIDGHPSSKPRSLSVSLWLPLLLIAAPTAWLWRTDRRAKPWQCANCRYDLRGLEPDSSKSQPTICPECGTTKYP